MGNGRIKKRTCSRNLHGRIVLDWLLVYFRCGGKWKGRYKIKFVGKEDSGVLSPAAGCSKGPVL